MEEAKPHRVSITHHANSIGSNQEFEFKGRRMQNHKKTFGTLRTTICLMALFGSIFFSSSAFASQLDDSCVVSILNRNAYVQPDGSWSLPNIPSNMGQVRARATCVKDGVTVSGQSDYFAVATNGITDVGTIKFEAEYEQVPSSITISSGKATLTSVGDTTQLTVTALYPDGSMKDITAGSEGSTYIITNPAIATVDANGLIIAVSSGTVIISASNEQVLSSMTLTVSLGGDSDGDGIPDDWEIANGLNPNNPIDALEDPDLDGLTSKEEFELGTDMFSADSDGDGINDGEEIVAGDDGFVTNPLLADSDGDGIQDGLEVTTGSDPNNSASYNLADALFSIEVTPSTFVMSFNTIDVESTRQLAISGLLIDGSTIDLTSKNKGTNYSSSDLTVANFGLTDGLVYAGDTGFATITVSNNGFTDAAVVTIRTFSPTALSYVNIPYPGYANNVDVSEDYAYVAGGSGGLYVIDVSNPGSPYLVATENTPGNANDVKISGDLALIADGSSGLQVINISNPNDPVTLGSADTYNAWDVVYAGTYAYIADDAHGLKIIDFSNPSAPVIVGSVDTPGIAKGVDVDTLNGIAVVADGNRGVQIINISNPSSPQIVGSVDTPYDSVDITLSNGVAYVADYTQGGLKAVDVSNPAAPVIISTETVGGYLFDVATFGKYAFGADVFRVNAVPIYDISSPDNIIFRAILDFRQYRDDNGTGIAVSPNYLYLTASRSIIQNGTSAYSGYTRLYIGQYADITDTGTIAPTVSLTSPADGAEVVEGRSIPISVNATDDVLVAAVNFMINGEVVYTDTAAPYQYNYKAPIGETSAIISASAIDLAGNIGGSEEILINIITDPEPVVTITSPEDGANAIEGSTINIKADVVDNAHVAKVEFIVDGKVASVSNLPLENVALGKTATASSSYYSSYYPNKAVDGNTGTYWYSYRYAPVWWEVDLGKEYTIEKIEAIVYQWYSGNSTQKVWFYDDNGAAILAHTFEGYVTRGQTRSHNFASPMQNVRKIRIETTSGQGKLGLYEVRAFGYKTSGYQETFEYNHTLSLGAGSKVVGVRATDIAGKVGSAEVTINVILDPLTTVVGTVVNVDGSPVPGATVATNGGTSASTYSDGSFSIVNVPTILGNISVSASAEVNGIVLRGSSASVLPIVGGVTDVGNIALTGFNKVALLGADYNVTQVKDRLVNTGRIAAGDIGIIDTKSLTPTLDQLQGYDAVLVWTNYRPYNATALGDVLADYVDGGGGVVIASFGYAQGWSINGRIMQNGYSPFINNGSNYYGYRALDTSTSDMTHPVLNGVSSLSSVYGSTVIGLNSDSTVIAMSTLGSELIGQNTKGNVIGILMYPGFSFTGDYDTLLMNALQYSAFR